jgi:hypothetical protein
MSYVSEIQDESTLPLLCKGRVGEGLRKKISQKKMYIKLSYEVERGWG